jgi:valyl-tRNA synthetase
MNLKLLHPFMPFITEHLWSELSDRKLLNKGGLLMVSTWPK